MRRLLLAALLVLPSMAKSADVTTYLPADTDVVVTIQVRQIAESELGKKVGVDLIKELLGFSKQATAAVEATGLDPLKDFELVTVGMDLDKLDNPKPFALLEGKWDLKKVEAAIEAYAKANPTKLATIKVGEKAAYKLPGSKPQDMMFGALLDDSKLVIAATEADVTAAFEAAEGKRKPAISKEMANLLATAKSTAPIFGRAWVKGKLKDLKLPNEKLQAQIANVDWATAAITVTKDVSLLMTINTPDEKTAQVVSDLLGAAIGVVRLQLLAIIEDQPELKPLNELLRGTRTAPNGKTVLAAGSVKGESIEKALKLLKTPMERPKR